MIRLAWLLLAMTLLTNGWPTAIKSQVRKFLLSHNSVVVDVVVVYHCYYFECCCWRNCVSQI